MKKILHRSINWGKAIATTALLPVGMALVTATTTPVSAQSTIIIEGGYYPNDGYYYPKNDYYYPPSRSQPSQATPFIYGSPIAAPIPVDPNTGLPPKNNTYSYPAYPDSYRNRIQDSTIVNPVLVNPRIRDSTIVNPVIVDDPRSGVPDGRRAPRFRGARSDRY